MYFSCCDKGSKNINMQNVVSVIFEKLPKKYNVDKNKTDPILSMANEIIRLLEARVRVGKLGKYDSRESRAVIIIDHVLKRNVNNNNNNGEPSLSIPIDELVRTVAIRNSRDFRAFRSTLKKYLDKVLKDNVSSISGNGSRSSQLSKKSRPYRPQSNRYIHLAPKSIIESMEKNRKSKKETKSSRSNSEMEEECQPESTTTTTMTSSSQWTIHDLAIRLSGFIHDPSGCAEKSQELYNTYHEYLRQQPKSSKLSLEDFNRHKFIYLVVCLFIVVKETEGYSLSQINSSITNRRKNTTTKPKINNKNNNINDDDNDDDAVLHENEEEDQQQQQQQQLDIVHILSVLRFIDEDLFRNISQFVIKAIQQLKDDGNYKKYRILAMKRKMKEKQEEVRKRKSDEQHLAKDCKRNKTNDNGNGQITNTSHSGILDKDSNGTEFQNTKNYEEFIKWKEETLAKVVYQTDDNDATRRELLNEAADKVLVRLFGNT